MQPKKNELFDISDEPPVQIFSRWGLIIIIFFLGGFTLWSLLAKIESAAIAPGKIVVSGNRKIIQHLEGGIIRKIYVRNGETVQKGQQLLKIDDTQYASKYHAAFGKELRLLANEARLLALIEKKDQVQFPNEVKAHSNNIALKTFLKTQTESFKSEKSAAQGQTSILKKRIIQLKKQIIGTESQLKSTKNQLQLIQKELVAIKKLEKAQLVDRSRLLSLQREEQRLMGLKGQYKASIANLQQKIGETQLDIINQNNLFNKRWHDELSVIREKLALAKESKNSAEDIFKRTIITSPISGTVMNLNVFTLGAVIKPGENLLEIVPKDEKLVIDARINPLDIDVVKKGMLAKINLSALKTRTTPTLLGSVSYIDPDAKTDERNQTSYYSTRIKIKQDELKKIGLARLHPGMPVEVMIITNKLTPWEYFLDPIKRSINRAFRED